MFRQILAFLTAVAILGIAQYLSATAWAAFAILLLMAAVTHPRHVTTFIATLGLLAMALRAPAAMAAALGLIGAASVVTGRILRSRRRPAVSRHVRPARGLLPSPRRQHDRPS